LARLPFVYKFFDFTLAAEIPLAELTATDGGAPLFQIRLASPAPGPTYRTEWDWQWPLPSGEIFLSVARLEKQTLLQFPGVLDCVYRSDDRSIELAPAAGISESTVRHLVLDHVVPRLVSHQGRLVLHAAAVADGSGALLLLGQTGAGKSTLGASFLDNGFTLLTDDCVLLEPSNLGFRALAAYPGLRLWPDSLKRLEHRRSDESKPDQSDWKRRVELEPVSGGWQEVIALVVLEGPIEGDEPGEVSVAAMPGSGAVVELLQHGFLLDPTDQEIIERQFLAVGDLAGSLPLFRVTYPRDYSRLPDVRRSIVQALRDL
jgi:hypothetical protein